MSGTAPVPLAVNPQYSITESGVFSGAVAVPISFNLTPTQPVAVVNLQSMPTGTTQISHLQTLKIDNSMNSIGLIVTFIDTGDRLEVGPNEFGYYPTHTNALVFNVSVPLLPELQTFGLSAPVLFPVNMVALNYYIAPRSASFIGPTTDTAVTVTIGSGAAWNTAPQWVSIGPPPLPIPSQVPGVPGTVYTSLYSDLRTVGLVIECSSTDLSGNSWTVWFAPGTAEEHTIPPTAVGTPVQITALLPPNGGRTHTTASFPITWRVALLGMRTSTSFGASGVLTGGFSGAMANNLFIATNSQPVGGFPAPFFYLQQAIFACAGLSAAALFELIEEDTAPTTTNTPLAIISVPAGSSTTILYSMNWYNGNNGWNLGFMNVSGASVSGSVLITWQGVSTYASQLALT